MNEKRGSISVEAIRIVMGILSFSLFLSFLVCAFVRSSGVYRYLPAVMLVIFTVINFSLNRIPWTKQRKERRLLIQAILMIISIITVLNL